MRNNKTMSIIPFVFCWLLALSTNLAPIQAQTSERYEVAALRNVMITARDGVKLAPAGNSRLRINAKMKTPNGYRKMPDRKIRLGQRLFIFLSDIFL